MSSEIERKIYELLRQGEKSFELSPTKEEVLHNSMVKDHHQANIEDRRTRLENEKQNIELKRKFASRVFWLMVAFLVFVGLILLITLYQSKETRLSDPVIITLLTTTTTTILGLFAIVAKYLFYNLRHEVTEKDMEKVSHADKTRHG